MTDDWPVICIDGPSGAGKGTLAKQLADRLGFHYLDSGALYRITALLAFEKGVAMDDPAALAEIAGAIDVEFNGSRVLLGARDLNADLRLESTGERASKLAAYPEVRQALIDTQKRYLQAPGLVADGRDMGTAIFPDAGLKVFLTASAQIRAQRRYLQLQSLHGNQADTDAKCLKSKERSASLRALEEDIKARDERDANRSNSPLRKAQDAIEIETTDLSEADVLETVMRLWQQSRNNRDR